MSFCVYCVVLVYDLLLYQLLCVCLAVSSDAVTHASTAGAVLFAVCFCVFCFVLFSSFCFCVFLCVSFVSTLSPTMEKRQLHTPFYYW